MNVSVLELMERVDVASVELPGKPSAADAGPLPFAVMLGALEAEAAVGHGEEPVDAPPGDPSRERAPERDGAAQLREAVVGTREGLEPVLPESRAVRTGSTEALPVARVEQAPTPEQAGPVLQPSAGGPSPKAAPASGLASVDPEVAGAREPTPPEVGDPLPSDRWQRPLRSEAAASPEPDAPQTRPDEKQAAQPAASPTAPPPGRDHLPGLTPATGDVAARAIGRSPAELGASRASPPGEIRPRAASQEPGPAPGTLTTAPGLREAAAPEPVVQAAPRWDGQPEAEPSEPRSAMASKPESASSAQGVVPGPVAPPAPASGIVAPSAHAWPDALPASPIAPPTAPPTTAPVSATPESGTSARVELVAERIEWLMQRGGGSARVELDPPHLGHLELSVRVRGGEVDLRIVTQESSVFQLVQAERAQLADSLAGRELRLGSFDVRGETSSSDSGLPKQGSEQRFREDAAEPGAPLPRAVEPPQRTVTASVVSPTSRLDLRI